MFLRTLRAARASTLLLALTAIAAFTGCGAAGTPSGRGATASASGTTTGGGSGSGTGGSSGGAQTMRLVGFYDGATLPGSSTKTWLFWTESHSVQPGTERIIVNGGTPQKVTPTATIGGGTGILLIQAFNNGDTVQIGATQSGSPVVSNTITVSTAAANPVNLPTAQPPFQTMVPANNAQTVSISPQFTWTAAQTVTSYLVLCFLIVPNPQNPSQGVISDVPVCVELKPSGAGSQQFSVLSHPTQDTEFSNAQLMNLSQHVWSVCALDAGGFSIGTTIDVAGFNAAGSNAPPANVSATWPSFITQ